MSLEILTPVKYGNPETGILYPLTIGDRVKEDFFDDVTLQRLMKEGNIKKSLERPNRLPRGQELPDVKDVTQFTVAECKEFVCEEPDVTTLEKYIDQENIQEAPRSSLLKYIENRIKELTGYDYPPRA